MNNKAETIKEGVEKWLLTLTPHLLGLTGSEMPPGPVSCLFAHTSPSPRHCVCLALTWQWVGLIWSPLPLLGLAPLTVNGTHAFLPLLLCVKRLWVVMLIKSKFQYHTYLKSKSAVCIATRKFLLGRRVSLQPLLQQMHEVHWHL